MLARMLKLLLVLDCILVAATARLIDAVFDLGGGWALAAAVAVWLAGRAAFIGLTFFLANRLDDPRQGGTRPAFKARAGMLLRDYWSGLLLFSLVQPFERFFMGQDRLLKALRSRPVVLLIHGYNCNRGFWWRFRPALEAAGWQVATLNLEPVFGSIDAYAGQVAKRIDEILLATGVQRVMLVGHSMGGLVARACIAQYGAVNVAGLITLGTPHAGSRIARLAAGANGRQMEPASVWQRALATAEVPLALHVPLAAIYSEYDNFVSPRASARCPETWLNGSYRELGAVGHLGMATSPAVIAEVLKQLERMAGDAELHDNSSGSRTPVALPASPGHETGIDSGSSGPHE